MSRVAARIARTGEVLDLVRRGEAATTSQLAQAMGLARSTVAERVDLLLAQELLVTTEGPAPRRGRPPMALAFNAQAGLALTAQLGMSAIRVAATDLDGKVLWSRTVDLDIGHGPDAVLSRVEREFTLALADLGRSHDRVHGVGIGVPGIVELTTAQPTANGSARPWIDYPIAERLAESFPGPVFVEKDVNLLAFGEHRASWPDAEVYLFVKVGTVIGCGVVVGKQVARGATGLAGEIGHTHVPGATSVCVCGNTGCLNAVASGGALARSLAELGHPTVTARDVATVAGEGVVEAGHAVRDAGREIGKALAGAINLLNPKAITLWGYLADAGDHLFAGVHESVYRYAVHAATRDLHIEKSRLGMDAGTRGAAMMVVERTLLPAAVDRHILHTQR